MSSAFFLKGIHRHYDWGGDSYLPHLFEINNDSKQPYAEYWMGAHPSAPSIIETTSGTVNLFELINSDPQKFLGITTFSHFHSLPYLFKILDVAKMLSIQVHPSIESAIDGFEAEEAAGIPINASNRNYKDKNHKPEIMVALSDFWLLHGFLPQDQLKNRLLAYESLQPFMAIFENGSYKALYQTFMELPQSEVDTILLPLVKLSIQSIKDGNKDKLHPFWWVNKYYGGIVPTKNIDKGIFSIFIMNIMFVTKYQAVFQGAGILHAYLEGQNIELMANSDNVLRGGLTSKHIDVPELLKHVLFEPTIPELVSVEQVNHNEIHYPCPVKDFSLSKIDITAGETYTIHANSLEIVLLMEGEVHVETLGTMKPSNTLLVLPNNAITIKASQKAVIFRAYVP